MTAERETMPGVMVDSDKAIIFPGINLARQKPIVGFQTASILEEDGNRRHGAPIGYVMHPHCWLLVDRFLGHEVVKRDLRAFLRAIEVYWRADLTLWMPDLVHGAAEFPCYDDAAPWIKQNLPVYVTGASDRTHVSESPLTIPDIRRMITKATQEHEKAHRPDVSLSSIITRIPIEIKIIIIDKIYRSPPPCHERIQNTRNVLEAFQWEMPDSYWQKLCNPTLIFEVEDTIKAGTPIEWAYFCQGLRELLLQKDWYCNNGLFFRGRILHLTECIKGSLSGTV
ncbi:hypothetical protein AbraIFM66950_010102 [Aspergillus brasiliensis]|nr:hypothetical protein AbraIFM66950_010102 [Aspergillus brasiliensis]